MKISYKLTCLKDGTPITIRPARPADFPLLKEMYDRLSTRSLYNRYLYTHAPSVDEIKPLCNIEPERGMAFVAVVYEPTERIIGIAHYIIEHETPHVIAEPCFLIEDAYQNLGLGTKLSKHLSEYAIASGVERFDTLVHSGNTAMIRVFRKTGYPITGNHSYGTWEAEIKLVPETEAEALYMDADRAYALAPEPTF